MQLGVAIAIFLILATVLLILFYLITKYFQKRLRQAIEMQKEIYSLIEGADEEVEDMAEGEYEDFVMKRIEDHKKREKMKDKNYQLMLELTNIGDPLAENNDNIYGCSQLKKKLGQPYTFPKMLDSHRSVVSHKGFHPDRLDRLTSHRSNKSKSRQSLGSNESLPRQPTRKFVKVTKHKYVKKMVAYTSTGLTVIQNIIKQVWIEEEGGAVKENKNTIKTHIDQTDPIFKNSLEAYGMEEDNYDAFKYQICLQIANMKPHEIYPVSALKAKESKESMNLQSFENDREQITKSTTKYEQIPESP